MKNTTKQNKKTCYIYSRTANDYDLNSLVFQNEECRKYAEQHNYSVIEIFPDLGTSGSTLKRIGLSLMLERITKHKVDAIIIFREDRLSRRIADYILLSEYFAGEGAEVISVSNGGRIFKFSEKTKLHTKGTIIK